MEEKFNYVKRGYDPDEVNTYIDTLEKVLTSYKEKDNAIKNALINAQIAAENIVKNAELEADKIVAKALQLIDTINGSLQEQKQYVQAFQDEYNLLIGKYLHNINDADIQKINARINELEDYVTRIKNTAPNTAEAAPAVAILEQPVAAPPQEAAPAQPAPAVQPVQETPVAQAAPPVRETAAAQAPPPVQETAAAPPPKETNPFRQLKEKLF